MNFKFPGTYAELKDTNFSEFYRVKSKNSVPNMDDRLIFIKINQFQEEFHQMPTLIEDAQNFDFLYYLVEYLDKHSNQKAQFQLIDIFSFQILKLHNKNSKAFQMTLFLFLNLLQQKQVQGPQVKRALKQLKQLFSLNSFVDLDREGIRYVFDLIKMAIEIKETQIREVWIEVLISALIIWSKHETVLKNTIVHLMYEQESVVPNLSKFLVACSKHDKLKSYTIDQLGLLINFITEKSTNQTESLAVKNLRELLTISSKEMPKIYYQQLSSMIGLYDNENYHIRSGLSDVITNVIEYLVKESKEQNDDEVLLLNANNLTKSLISRHLDKTALCRSNVLQCLSQLLNLNCIQKIHLPTIFSISQSRLRDISGYARKSALQLLKSVSRCYRYIYVQSQGRDKFWSSKEIGEQIKSNQLELDNIHNDFQRLDLQFQEGNISEDQINDTIKNIKKRTQEIQKGQEYLDEYSKFLDGMKIAINQVLQLCQSKNQADVTHSIKLFAYLSKYDFESANIGLRRMLLLVWSQDKSIQQEVIKKFWKLYLKDNKNTKQIVLSIIDLISTSNQKELLSIEKIILSYETEQAPNYKLPNKAFSTLWDLFGRPEINQRSMLIFVRIMLTRNCSYFNMEKIKQIQELLMAYNRKDPDWIIIKELSLILSKLDRNQEKNQIYINNQIELLTRLLVKYKDTQDMNYFSACDSIIQLISLSYNPECKFEALIKQFEFEQHSKNSMELEQLSNNDKMHLTHAIYIAGCISLQLLVLIDKTHRQLKQLKNDRESQIGKEQEIDKISGGLEGEFERIHEVVNEIQDLNLVQQNLLSVFSPLVIMIIEDCLVDMENKKSSCLNQQSPLVQVCLITMCKFMCLSESYCRQNIEMLFNIMKCPLFDQVVKNNVLISIGDLLHMWPNTVQKFHKQIYSNLLDSNGPLRRVTLLVLTHLILNDMIKSKTSLSHIPVLLNDPCQQIQSMARYFLNELQKKEQRAISNAVPDIILNIHEHNEIIISQISLYIDKNLVESIVEKLVNILGISQNQSEIKNISILFNYMNLTQTSLQRFLDGWEQYREKLKDQFVYNQFISLIKKLRRTLPQESRIVIDEFEMKIENYDKETFENRRREKVSKRKNGKTQFQDRDDKELKENISNVKQQQRRKVKKKDEEILEIESNSEQETSQAQAMKLQTNQRRKRKNLQKNED
ncbi:unnamed protein product (macronuclear) [Paramecium tetraurelia]|uniref:Condensin complex subunit 1 C-terminal domain-containing protein n=1 Tax=Paramecium tetraurelia TaxID=5888 RepID=A0BCL6_PARTE|nr:uncharacterized protein GSPATT00004377001 [Paramecium tetraurelia]CAK56283.1 unnamed protein product [Paramecium tetraurelia]|eukprot:XP_001423681.1 hypothetical protein (macronuclear) [Paramecium tetraurelia strain d4-2]